jgi:hypothetical protein
MQIVSPYSDGMDLPDDMTTTTTRPMNKVALAQYLVELGTNLEKVTADGDNQGPSREDKLLVGAMCG